METSPIRLKKRADRRLRDGHYWIFSNEIADPPISELEPGALYTVSDWQGEFLGIGYANPRSLIACRILARKKIEIDGDFFRSRINKAASWRKTVLGDAACYRVVFSESDGLPGLIVDRYGSHFVCQSFTAGMDRFIDLIADVIASEFHPAGIYFRNDSPYRLLEGLPLDKRLVYGDISDSVIMASGGLQLRVDIVEGQKTGAFLDQEWNRCVMTHYVCKGAHVLDLFSYTGSWALHALAAGAAAATAVDTSKHALKLAQENAERNHLAGGLACVREPAVDFLKKQKKHWDVIVLDPPAFVKSRRDIEEGMKGYIDVNRRALLRLRPGGILVTCSCSQHIDMPTFERIIQTAGRQAGKSLRLLESRGQGPDHPVLMCMPETRYLKVLALQAL
ncbi:MAG: class I SAM-dependent rRNA methyltransferase [Desulfomonilaceae bacterium]